ncbi:MAG: redox-sensing transcriptional repressor Rex [Bacteroidales bacterium]
MTRNLPEKTIERLSQYRRVLLGCLQQGKYNIYSHELASLLHLNPVQVRRDIMLIGHSGTLRKGYDVKKLSDMIGEIIDCKESQKVAVVGVGNLGRAIMAYFQGKRTKLVIAAAFDSDPNKVNRVIAGIRCYHISELEEVIRKEHITIGVITVPPEHAAATAEKLVMAGIKGILNYTPVALNVEPHAYLEEYDMITSIEKVAFFVKNKG